MAGLAWPHVVDKLLALLPTLSGWAGVTIFDGMPLTGDDPMDYCTVGYTDSDGGGTLTQETDDDGYSITETGTIRLNLTCQSGDTSLVVLRSRAFGLLDTLNAALAADQTLGNVLAQDGTITLTLDVLSIQNEGGAAQSVIATANYSTSTFPH